MGALCRSDGELYTRFREILLESIDPEAGTIPRLECELFPQFAVVIVDLHEEKQHPIVHLFGDIRSHFAPFAFIGMT